MYEDINTVNDDELEDFNPPDQASELGADYYWVEPAS